MFLSLPFAGIIISCSLLYSITQDFRNQRPRPVQNGVILKLGSPDPGPAQHMGPGETADIAFYKGQDLFFEGFNDTAPKNNYLGVEYIYQVANACRKIIRRALERGYGKPVTLEDSL